MQVLSDKLPTQKLAKAGQSPWLDYISREMLASGKLKKLIEKHGILGVTSNPSIFQNAIGQGKGYYSQDIKKMAAKKMSVLEIYDALSISDIQKACDLFKKVHQKTKGEHGYVSLEVLPNIAHDTKKTISEGLRLFKRVNRPNIMIKVPATAAGIPAIRELIASGVSINVTLIFSIHQYRQVAQAYLEGLKLLEAKKGKLSPVRSVASVFVSRFDTYLDKQLQSLIDSGKASEKEIKSLMGKAAVANSKLIYQEFKQIFQSDKFSKLRKSGAQIQKVLWGSTSSKNPAYPDLMYVEPLVGPETVNTMPQVTVDALLDHGRIVPNTIEEGIEDSKKIFQKFQAHGYELNKVGDLLQSQGVKAFCDSFDELMCSLESACQESRLSASKKTALKSVRYVYGIPDGDRAKIRTQIEQSLAKNVPGRLFAQDPTIWKVEDDHKKVILNRLGWLKVHEWIQGKLYEIDRLKNDIQNEKYQDIVLLGMGGSSLAPEVLSLIARTGSTKPRFCILDSTDPESIIAVEKKVTLQKTLFIVASKSGGTIETNSQFLYFHEKVTAKYGKKSSPEDVGRHFVAITDAGSSLEKTAFEKKFRTCFINPTNIGGRYSVLSLFGMVPAGLMGIDVRELLQFVKAIYEFTSDSKLEVESNPALYLGEILGYYASHGKDKLTIVSSKSLASFGSWLEQLIAESTGKEKKGVLPVDSEPVGNPEEYAEDRVFVFLRLEKETLSAQEKKLMAFCRKTRAPYLEIIWNSPKALGGQFWIWEVVTSIAGVILGINPFDEPNVKESKDITAKLLTQLKQQGTIENPTRCFSVDKFVELGLILKQVKRSSYIALLAYMDRNPKTEALFDRIRKRLRQHFKVPVLLGFGPRYLHSIGQFYKGGTGTGLFIEFVVQDRKDIQVPQAFYTFAQLKRAQALGDFEAIQNKGLPIIITDLGRDGLQGLVKFENQVNRYLSLQKPAPKSL